MVNQKVVAKRAGVSSATVSNVLNDTHFVSDKLKEKVLCAIKELNYEPNAIARGLKTKKSKTLGLIFSDILNLFFTVIAKNIETVAARHGYSVIFCDGCEDYEEELIKLRIMRERRVDGLIIVPTGGNVEYVNSLLEGGMRIVQIDRKLNSLKIDTITVDNEEITYEAVKYLIDLGHVKIGVITLPQKLTPIKERLKGYFKALNEANININLSYIKEGSTIREEGYKMAMELLNMKDRPTAIFTLSNRFVLGILKAIKEFGLMIPKDISLIVFDDVEYFPEMTPPITAVSQPVHEIGSTAAELVIKRIEQESKFKPKHIILKPTLVIRDSCRQI
ncbi:MAG: LacI family transcriptional regulator [Actinobacteria bacterium]|nr:LacI family transcriptional regulator [Actinomycetota bacterium]